LGSAPPFGTTTNPLGSAPPFGTTTNPLGSAPPFSASTKPPATFATTFGSTFKVPPVPTPTTFGAPFESTNAFSLNKSSNNAFISQNNTGNIWSTIKSK